MQYQKNHREVCEKSPIWACAAPLPEVVRSRGRGRSVCEGLCGTRRSVVESDVKKKKMNRDHQERLNEEREAEMCTKPVVDSEVNVVSPGYIP